MINLALTKHLLLFRSVAQLKSNEEGFDVGLFDLGTTLNIMVC